MKIKLVPETGDVVSVEAGGMLYRNVTVEGLTSADRFTFTLPGGQQIEAEAQFIRAYRGAAVTAVQSVEAAE